MSDFSFGGKGPNLPGNPFRLGVSSTLVPRNRRSLDNSRSWIEPVGWFASWDVLRAIGIGFQKQPPPKSALLSMTLENE